MSIFGVSVTCSAADYLSGATHFVLYELNLFIWHCFLMVPCSSMLAHFLGPLWGVWRPFAVGKMSAVCAVDIGVAVSSPW